MERILLLLIITNSLIVRALAGEAETLFAEGNKAYKQQEFAKAVGKYEQVLSAGYRSADLEYNLGNAWYRQDSPGRAALHYERALLLRQDHAEAAKNLAFIRSKAVQDIEALPAFFLSRWWKAAKMSLPANTMGMTAMVLWWLGFGAVSFRFFSKNNSWRKKSLLVGATLLLVSVLPFSLSISRASFDKDSRLAILIQKSAILRSQPDDSSVEVATIYEGTKLSQAGIKDGWCQVLLENGETGWLPEQAMEKI